MQYTGSPHLTDATVLCNWWGRGHYLDKYWRRCCLICRVWCAISKSCQCWNVLQHLILCDRQLQQKLDMILECLGFRGIECHLQNTISSSSVSLFIILSVVSCCTLPTCIHFPLEAVASLQASTRIILYQIAVFILKTHEAWSHLWSICSQASTNCHFALSSEGQSLWTLGLSDNANEALGMFVA